MKSVAIDPSDAPERVATQVGQQHGSTQPEAVGSPPPDAASVARPMDGTSKRRFLIAVLIGIAVAAVPYLWVLCDLWTRSPSLLRTARSDGYASNFYDLQARAMMHGHLYVANGALGGEAFVHGGHQYTYFGIFPSLLRMPVLLVTSSLDGKLSALSLLLAWLVTALFVSLLVWRLRMVVRGPVLLGRAEAASYGVLVATVMGGSVLMALASSPWVFSEDMAWSVALTIGSLFALLGVLERPSWGRVLASGGLILAASLNRGSTGYACVLGAILVALWFAVVRRELSNRRWSLPMLLAGLVPLAAGCAVNYAKFGILFGLAESDQLVYQAFRFKGSYFGLHYLPSTLLAYFGPTGLRLRTVFPFITFPSSPARAVGNIHLYGNDWVASVPTATPLLFLLALWGTITTVRPGGETSSFRIRIVLATAAAAGVAVMVYGWIANRFVADLIPVLVVAAAVGMVDLWRRFSSARRRRRRRVLIVIMTLGLFGVAANTGVAASFQKYWSSQQLQNFLGFQETISNLTGHPLDRVVMQGTALPLHAAAGQLFIAGDCEGLYLATGLSDGSTVTHEATLLGQFYDLSSGWVPVEQSSSIIHTVDISVRATLLNSQTSVPLAIIGGDHPTTLWVGPSGPGAIRFTMSGPLGPLTSPPMSVDVGTTYRLSVVLDTFLHSVSITSAQGLVFGVLPLLSTGHVVMKGSQSSAGSDPLLVSVRGPAEPLPPGSLCQRLR
jgi:hypothetical protein